MVIAAMCKDLCYNELLFNLLCNVLRYNFHRKTLLVNVTLMYVRSALLARPCLLAFASGEVAALVMVRSKALVLDESPLVRHG